MDVKARRVSRKKVLEPLKEGFKGFFVIHDHYATQHHWDLRLEWPVRKGVDINKVLEEEWKSVDIEELPQTRATTKVLRSWAIPKHRLPKKVGEKLRMSETLLHTWEYRNFEGVIEKGYGEGDVYIAHKGKYEVLDYHEKDDVLVAWLKADIDDVFSIVPTNKKKNEWLIIKLDKRKWLDGGGHKEEAFVKSLCYGLSRVAISVYAKEKDIDELAVAEAAFEMYADIFGDDFEFNAFAEAVKRAIEMAKDTEDAIGILKSFLRKK